MFILLKKNVFSATKSISSYVFPLIVLNASVGKSFKKIVGVGNGVQISKELFTAFKHG